jgi:hypothetical protein
LSCIRVLGDATLHKIVDDSNSSHQCSCATKSGI